MSKRPDGGLPNRLPILRAERGRVPQFDVADACGISRNRYWRIENGYTEPTDEEKAALAVYFNVSAARVFARVRGVA